MLARLLVPVLLCSSIASTAATQTVTPPPAVPIEPIAAIIDAFRSRSVVALPDAHGNEQRHAFLVSLIGDPRVAATVNDIVVEFGRVRYRGVIDRFRFDDFAAAVQADWLRRWCSAVAPIAASPSCADIGSRTRSPGRRHERSGRS
jgi:hypothetical protein